FAADGENQRADFRLAERFGAALARRLQIDPSYLVAGYEDAWHYLERERRLPVNVDPHRSNLRDPEERARLARIVEQGPEPEVCVALPLQRVRGGEGEYWTSGPWFLRSERMYLLPGDSPMGLRLPLDSLPWVAASDAQHDHEADPFAPREALPPRA